MELKMDLTVRHRFWPIFRFYNFLLSPIAFRLERETRKRQSHIWARTRWVKRWTWTSRTTRSKWTLGKSRQSRFTLWHNKTNLSFSCIKVLMFLMCIAGKVTEDLFSVLGLPGIKGERGRGRVGPPGFTGRKGDKGSAGSPGSSLYNLFKGVYAPRWHFVFDFLVGPNGRVGDPGQRGSPGLPGRGSVGFATSLLIARHSQSIRVPECPHGTSLIYSGYSFLFINGNERTHGQDLGKNVKTLVNKNTCPSLSPWMNVSNCLSGSIGSCLPRFSTMPYLFCDIESNCRYASRNDYSYWLSTNQPMPQNMVSIAGDQLANYISR